MVECWVVLLWLTLVVAQFGDVFTSVFGFIVFDVKKKGKKETGHDILLRFFDVKALQKNFSDTWPAMVVCVM